MSTTTFLSMKQAAAWLGPRRNGTAGHEETIRVWCKKGLRGVRLQSQVRGGIRVTTEQWLEDFFRDVEAARGRTPAPPGPSARKRSHEAATKRLREMGVM
jgi:hypothetical protein